MSDFIKKGGNYLKQNQQFRGLGLVLLVIALCVLASALTQQGGLFSEEMSHLDFTSRYGAHDEKF